MTTIAILANLAVFVAVIAWLAGRQRRGAKLSSSVLIALLVGAGLGALAQAIYGLGSPIIRDTMTWVNVVGSGYVRLLQMVIAPLVLISILAAVTKLSSTKSLGAISVGVIGLLMVMTAASALIGVAMTRTFGLRADGLVQGAREVLAIEPEDVLLVRHGETPAIHVLEVLVRQPGAGTRVVFVQFVIEIVEPGRRSAVADQRGKAQLACTPDGPTHERRLADAEGTGHEHDARLAGGDLVEPARQELPFANAADEPRRRSRRPSGAGGNSQRDPLAGGSQEGYAPRGPSAMELRLGAGRSCAPRISWPPSPPRPARRPDGTSARRSPDGRSGSYRWSRR